MMANIKKHSIFFQLPAAKKREVFQVLQKGKGFNIERIVSCGQATPEGQWLCSKAAEWVIVQRGRARLRFKGAREPIELKAGDYVFIPGKTCHRVEWTHPERKTVWLAVHIKNNEG
ncbi:MAG: cupin domain-containing protein [Candidatus Omnitrophota bacterium]